MGARQLTVEESPLRSAEIRLSSGLLILLVMFAGGCSGTRTKTDIPPVPRIPAAAIFKSEHPIKIDGVLDESAWTKARPIEANYRANAVGERERGHFMVARFAWDNRYLYIGYEVADTDLVAITDGRTKGPPKNKRTTVLPWAPERKLDCVEFFVSMGDERFMWEIQHNALNHLNDVFLNVLDPDWPINRSTLSLLGVILNNEQYIKDNEAATVKFAVRMKPNNKGQPSTPNNPEDVDTGYVGELRFPWESLGAPISARNSARQKQMPPGSWDLVGHELMILSVVLHGDSGNAVYHHSSPTRPAKGMFATAAKHFPRYLLIKK